MSKNINSDRPRHIHEFYSFFFVALRITNNFQICPKFFIFFFVLFSLWVEHYVVIHVELVADVDDEAVMVRRQRKKKNRNKNKPDHQPVSQLVMDTGRSIEFIHSNWPNDTWPAHTQCFCFLPQTKHWCMFSSGRMLCLVCLVFGDIFPVNLSMFFCLEKNCLNFPFLSTV